MARPTVDRLYSTEIGHVKLRSVQTGLVSTGALVSRADMEDTIQHPLPNKIVLTRKINGFVDRYTAAESSASARRREQGRDPGSAGGTSLFKTQVASSPVHTQSRSRSSKSRSKKTRKAPKGVMGAGAETEASGVGPGRGQGHGEPKTKPPPNPVERLPGESPLFTKRGNEDHYQLGSHLIVRHPHDVHAVSEEMSGCHDKKGRQVYIPKDLRAKRSSFPSEDAGSQRYEPSDELVKALPARDEPVVVAASAQPSPLRAGQTLKAWREVDGRPQTAGAARASRTMSSTAVGMGATGGEERSSWTGAGQVRPRTSNGNVSSNQSQLMDTISTEVRPLGERKVKNASREATVFGHVSAVVAAPGDATWRAYKYGQPRPTAGAKGMPGGIPPRPTTASGSAQDRASRPESAQPLRVIQHDVTTNVYRKKAPRVSSPSVSRTPIGGFYRNAHFRPYLSRSGD
mmetsp:Transcript_12130/g.32819  ORF Transcript_12130/g.32819 Transcript_12130/m.32819 type:complete len:458 (+) Transcript_12130:415-1788(+)